MSGRRAVCIEDIAEKVAMGPFGSNIKVSTFVDVGVPVISGQHLHDFRLTDRNYNFITKEHAEKLKNSNVFRGDVVFTHAGNIGQVSYIPEGSKYERYVLSQRQFYLRCNKKVANAAWLTYFFKSRDGQAKLLANASQVGVPSIARPASYLKTIELELPPLHEQDEVVRIIDAINDKIALNRKLNATLEAMAQALFQSWFVDFDPVKAKLAAVRCGRDPEQAAMAAIACKLVVPPGKPKAETLDAQLPSADTIDAAIVALAELSEAQRQSLKEKAAHFPADFQESELGLIPLGWEVKALGELCSQSIGGQWGSEEDHPDLVPAICLRGCDMADITKGGYAPSAPIRFIKLNALEKRRITESDLLIASSGAGPCGRPLWCSSNLSQERYGFPVIYSNFVKRFTFGEPSEAIFAEMVLLPMYLNYSIGDYITGTSVPNLDSKGLLSGLNLCLPSKSLLRLFEKSYRYFEMCRSLDESRTLANLRDALLPKLLSGEISVNPN